MTLPPTTAVGSSPAAFSTVATIEVVVVFPWLPGDRHRVLQAHQLGEHLRAGDDRDLPLPARRRTSGLSLRTAEEMTTTSA